MTSDDSNYLFKNLIKDGCTWQGDIISPKWREHLYMPAGVENFARASLEQYVENVDYKIEGNFVWIA